MESSLGLYTKAIHLLGKAAKHINIPFIFDVRPIANSGAESWGSLRQHLDHANEMHGITHDIEASLI